MMNAHLNWDIAHMHQQEMRAEANERRLSRAAARAAMENRRFFRLYALRSILFRLAPRLAGKMVL